MLMFKLSTHQFRRPRSFSTAFTSLHENPLVRPQFSNCMLTRPTLSRACLPAPMQLLRCPVGADPSKRNPYPTSQKFSQSPVARVALGRARSLVRMIFLCVLSAYELFYPVNLAFALAMRKPRSLGRRLRVGILDLDIFGPSVPTLMGLQHSDEPALTSGRFSSHCPFHPLHYPASKRRCNIAYHEPWTADHVNGIPSPKVNREQVKRGCRCCMERFNGSESSATTPFRCGLARVRTRSWLGCLGDRHATRDGRCSLDTRAAGYCKWCVIFFILYSLLLLTPCDATGAIIVSTPQDVALADVRRGISMFRKISVPVRRFQLSISYTD